MDWDRLRVFHAVADAGAFTRAGERLGLSQSAISRQISALEESLDVTLFHRHARGLVLTEQGATLYDTVREVFSKLALAEARIKDSKAKPEGNLRISTTVSFGSTWLTPRLKAFRELYPEIGIDLILDDRPLDLGMLEADVSIRFTPPTQIDLIQRKLADFHYHLYASPAYLEEMGTPARLEDLDHHRLVVYGAGRGAPIKQINWPLTARAQPSRPRTPVLQVNNIHAVLLAVESGLGIATLPDYMARRNAEVAPVLPEEHGPQVTAYFVYPQELRDSQRIGVFRDFLVDRIKDWTF